MISSATTFYAQFFSSILGGCCNYIATKGNFGAIAGGFDNRIFGNSQEYSFIDSGYGNTVLSTFSAIPGGRNNTVSHAYSAAFGHGITSASACTFHVNCLNAINTPAYLSQPAGSIVWKHCGSIAASDMVLVLHP